MRFPTTCAAAVSFACAASAATLDCDNGVISVTATDPGAGEAVCRNADAVLADFAQCGLPSYPRPVTVEVQAAIPGDCIGVFHCGEDRIEILSRKALEAAKSRLDLFAHLSTDRLFASVLRHEMAHALFDATPCPFDSCIASSEYFAYTQQIAALSDAERAPIEERIDPDETIERDTINALILFMAPDRFVTAAWAHFEARGDRCSYWTALLDGHVGFDRVHP